MSASTIFKFGKHKTKTFQYVFEHHPDYVQWANEQNATGQLMKFVEFCAAEGVSSSLTAAPMADWPTCSRCRRKVDFESMSEIERREYGMTEWCRLCQDAFFHGGLHPRRPRNAGRNPLQDKCIHIALKLGDDLLFCTGTSSKVFVNLDYLGALEKARQVWQDNPTSFQKKPTELLLSTEPKTMHLIWTDQRQYDLWDPLTAGTCVEKNIAEQKDSKITVKDLMSLQALIFILHGDIAQPRGAKRRRK